jgi:hypothetical protein
MAVQVSGKVLFSRFIKYFGKPLLVTLIYSESSVPDPLRYVTFGLPGSGPVSFYRSGSGIFFRI